MMLVLVLVLMLVLVLCQFVEEDDLDL